MQKLRDTLQFCKDPWLCAARAGRQRPWCLPLGVAAFNPLLYLLSGDNNGYEGLGS